MKILTATDLPLASRYPPVRAQAFNLIKDFFSFVRKPTRRHPRRGGVKARTAAILVLLAWSALFTLLVCAPMMLVLNHAIGLGVNPRLGTGTFMFGAVVLAPVIEELMFRAGLRSAWWTVFGMPAMSATLMQGWKVPLYIAVLTGVTWLVDQFRRRRLSAEAIIRFRWRRGRIFIGNYKLVVYMYACIFAAAHFMNFILEAGSGWKSVFLILAVMSQLMNGLVFSYLRLRYGLLSSMAAHFAWNAGAVGMALLGG